MTDDTRVVIDGEEVPRTPALRVKRWWNNGGRYTIGVLTVLLLLSTWISYTVWDIANETAVDIEPASIESVSVIPAAPGAFMATETVVCNLADKPLTLLMSFSLVNSEREDVTMTPSSTRTAPEGCSSIGVIKTVPASVVPDSYQLTVTIFSEGIQHSTSGSPEPFDITAVEE
jgi:hypothetical protein